VTWLIRMCDMTHSYVWHDAFVCVTWRIRMCDMTHSDVSCRSYVGRAPRDQNEFACCRCIKLHLLQQGLIRLLPLHMCNMTHAYVWHDSFECVTWLIGTCDMTHSYVWHDSFICRSHTSASIWACLLQCVVVCCSVLQCVRAPQHQVELAPRRHQPPASRVGRLPKHGHARAWLSHYLPPLPASPLYCIYIYITWLICRILCTHIVRMPPPYPPPLPASPLYCIYITHHHMTHLSCVVYISYTPFEDASSSSSSAACMYTHMQTRDHTLTQTRDYTHTCVHIPVCIHAHIYTTPLYCIYIIMTWIMSLVLYICHISLDSFVVYCIYIISHTPFEHASSSSSSAACITVVLYIYNISHDSIVYISHITWLICRVLYIYHVRLLRMPPPHPPPLPVWSSSAAHITVVLYIYHTSHDSFVVYYTYITHHMTHLSCIVYTHFEDASSLSSSTSCINIVLYIYHTSHDSFVVCCIYITHAFWGCLLLILLRCPHHRCIVYIAYITWLTCRVLYIHNTSHDTLTCMYV